MIRYFKEGAVLPKQLVVEKTLMSKTVSQLREMAKENGVELPIKATKAEIVKALSESNKQGAFVGSLICFIERSDN